MIKDLINISRNIFVAVKNIFLICFMIIAMPITYPLAKILKKSKGK